MTGYDKGHVDEVRDRLHARKLTDQDVAFIEQRLGERVEVGDLGEVDGRRIVARLPNGFDIIK